MTIASTLSTIKAGLARTNLFSITIGQGIGPLLQIRGKGTQLPASDLGVIEVPYRGRKLKVPGQRTFAEWTVTIMETEGMEVRTKMEAWINGIDNAETGARNPAKMEDITVSLLKANGGASMTYTLFGAFPTSIASVDLSFDEQTAPLEYQVTFNYSYHTVTGGGGGGQQSGSQGQQIQTSPTGLPFFA